MTPLSHRQQLTVGLLLALLMLLTRGQHLSAVGFAPDASWAVFLLAAVYLRPAWALPFYMLLAFLMDVTAVTWGGVSGFCMSPAYLMLVPTHIALWGAGRWYRHAHRDTISTLFTLGGAVLASSILAELLSSGGFYLVSGRFADLSLAELGSRLTTYYPSSLEALVLYVGMAAIIHGAVLFTTGARSGRTVGG